MTEKITINQIAAIYELQPWQRDLLAGMLMRDRRRRRAEQAYRESYLERTEQLFNRIVRNLSTGKLDHQTSESQPTP